MVKKGEVYIFDDGTESRVFTLLSYFWPDKEWYIGFYNKKRRLKVTTRKHDHLKDLIDKGTVRKITTGPKHL